MRILEQRTCSDRDSTPPRRTRRGIHRAGKDVPGSALRAVRARGCASCPRTYRRARFRLRPNAGFRLRSSSSGGQVGGQVTLLALRTSGKPEKGKKSPERSRSMSALATACLRPRGARNNPHPGRAWFVRRFKGLGLVIAMSRPTRVVSPARETKAQRQRAAMRAHLR
jgi:hypothetical protein